MEAATVNQIKTAGSFAGEGTTRQQISSFNVDCKFTSPIIQSLRITSTSIPRRQVTGSFRFTTPMDRPSTSEHENANREHQLCTVNDLALVHPPQPPGALARHINVQLIQLQLRTVDDMQSLTSRLIQSTIEISGDLIDPTISKDAKTTHAVEALLDHLGCHVGFAGRRDCCYPRNWHGFLRRGNGC